MIKKLRRARKCLCGCGNFPNWNLSKRCWNYYLPNHHLKNKKLSVTHRKRISLSNGGDGILKEKIIKLCLCGCGEMTTKAGNDYILGHQTKHRIFTKESRILLSKQKMGDKNPAKRPEVRNKISKSVLKLKLKGENHYNWQGGLSKEPYSQEWTKTLKKAIRQRDNYKCQVCLKPQRKQKNRLDVHHIDYNKENCDPDNLISLCKLCHIKTNNNREKWTSFFNGRKVIRKVS